MNPRHLVLASVVLASGCKADPLPDPVQVRAGEMDAAVLAHIKISDETRAKHQPFQATPIPPRASDTVFLRRVYLDLIGRVPGADEARRFLDDSNANKRSALIDRLLASEEASEQRFVHLANLLRVKDQVLGVSQQPYIDWLRKAAREDMPLDELFRQLITASGDVQNNPATGYLLTDHGQMMLTVVDLVRVCHGEDIQCARCHDHPFSDATQRQCYELAACISATRVVRTMQAPPWTETKPPDKSLLTPVRRFPAKPEPLITEVLGELWPHQSGDESPMRPGEHLVLENVAAPSLMLPSNYKYRDGKPGEVLQPRLPHFGPRGPKSLFAERQARNTLHGDGGELRARLAAWLTFPESKRFASLAALRVWNQLFGSIRPPIQSNWQEGDLPPAVEQSRSGRDCQNLPATGLWQSPKLLEGAPDIEFAMSKLYQQTQGRVREMQRILANTEAYQREAIVVDERYYFSGSTPVSAAPLVRRLSAEQVWDSLASLAQTPEKRSNALPQVLPQQHSLHVLGRSQREWSLDASQGLISHGTARWLASGLWQDEFAHAERAFTRCEDAFIALLGREPTTQERSSAQTNEQADVLWALINTTEFLFQH